MTPTEQDIAQRLAKHERWQWVPGIGVHVVSSRPGQDPDRLIVADDRHWHAAGSDGERPLWIRYRVEAMTCKHIPDLADPSTQGHLTAMLGDRLDRVHHHIPSKALGIPKGWSVYYVAPDDSRKSAHGPTLGEALARALIETWSDDVGAGAREEEVS